MARDPVCGLELDPRASATAREHGGERYVFHDTACADLFDADPEYYAEKQREIEAIRRNGGA